MSTRVPASVSHSAYHLGPDTLDVKISDWPRPTVNHMEGRSSDGEGSLSDPLKVECIRLDHTTSRNLDRQSKAKQIRVAI